MVVRGYPKISWTGEVDRDAIQKYNKQLKEALEREARLTRHYEWRGNKIVPFSIEPKHHVRSRLAQPMTDADRAARKQWVHDQHLSPNEPRYIPELTPRNVFRRVYGAPWDMLCAAIRPFTGEKYAGFVRTIAPKFALGYLGVCAFWYQIKYNPTSWEGLSGWSMIQTPDRMLPSDPNFPNRVEMQTDDFMDQGFKNRKAKLLD